MKKILLFLIIAFFNGLSLSAYNFLKVDSVGTLKGGIEFKNYSGTQKLDFYNVNGEKVSCNFKVDAMWPTSGPDSVVFRSRRDMIDAFNDLLFPRVSTSFYPLSRIYYPYESNFPEIMDRFIETKMGYFKGGTYDVELTTDLNSNGKTLSTFSYIKDESLKPYDPSNRIINSYRISDGEKFDTALLPDFKDIRRYMIIHSYIDDELMSDYKYQVIPFEKYPSIPPMFYEEELFFIWPHSELKYPGKDECYEAYIPYDELRSISSDQLKSFFPDELSNENSDSNAELGDFKYSWIDTDVISGREVSVFSYDVDWPIEGPQNIVEALRKQIVEDIFMGKELSLPNPTVHNLVEIADIYRKHCIAKDKEDNSAMRRNVFSSLSWNDASATVKSYPSEKRPDGRKASCTPNTTVIRLKDGKKLTPDMLPSWEKIRPLAIETLNNTDGYVENQLTRRNLPKPKTLPVFNLDHVELNWYPYESSFNADTLFTATIPYCLLDPIATPELKSFIPAPTDELYPFSLIQTLKGYEFESTTLSDNLIKELKYRGFKLVTATPQKQYIDSSPFLYTTDIYTRNGVTVTVNASRDRSKVYDHAVITFSTKDELENFIESSENHGLTILRDDDTETVYVSANNKLWSDESEPYLLFILKLK